MDLRKYPFDEQACKLEMETCNSHIINYSTGLVRTGITMYFPPVSHTTDEVVYEWDPLVPLDFEHEPNLPMHRLTKSETGDCTTEYSTGKFTCVSVTLHLERMPGNFLLTVVVPGAMVIVISSCALWASGRTVQVLVVSVAFLLWEAIVVLFNATSVPISYTRACDVYTGMVVTFAFCNLMLSMISGDGGVQEQVKLHNMPSMLDKTLPMFSVCIKKTAHFAIQRIMMMTTATTSGPTRRVPPPPARSPPSPDFGSGVSPPPTGARSSALGGWRSQRSTSSSSSSTFALTCKAGGGAQLG